MAVDQREESGDVVGGEGLDVQSDEGYAWC